MTYLYVAVGGALGSMFRYFMASFIGRQMGDGFPYGIMFINVSGSFLMGLFIGWMVKVLPARAEDIRIFIAVGVLGGYTTFSSFSLDAVTLLQHDRWMDMTIYVVASVGCSLVGLMLGQYIMRAFA